MALRDNEAEAVELAPERTILAPRPRRTIVDILPFSGKESEDITDWLIKWEIAAAANGWTEQHQLQILPAYLSGRAARLFWRFPEESKRDMETLKDALDEHFNTEEKRFLARQKLQETIQSTRESVMDFAERIDRLVVTGHDGLDDEDRKDRIACEQFIKGMRSEIKETVWEKCPRSFQEAITAAERREVYLNSMGRRSWVNDISEDLLMTIQRLNEERSKSNEEIWNAIQNLTSVVQNLAVQRASPAPQQPQRQAMQRIRCFKCNQPGHVKRNCPQNQNQSQNQNQQAYKPQIQTSARRLASNSTFQQDNQQL